MTYMKRHANQHRMRTRRDTQPLSAALSHINHVTKVACHTLTLHKFDMNLIRWLLVGIAFGNLSHGLELPPGTARPTEIVVIGQVAKPGAYKLTAGANLLDAIFAAGGFTNLGSPDIVIKSGENAVAQYTLHFDEKSEMVSFSTRGKSDDKRVLPVVTNGDLITIKTDLFMPHPWQPWSRAKAMKWKAEQAGTRQPATRPESKSKGGDKPQPDAKERSR